MELEPGGLHLAYCTNIHAGSGWEEVFSNLRTYAPELRRRLNPKGPFGLGLRLSAAEAEQLLEGGRLEQLRASLAEDGLYVALLNGFVFGGFHRTVVKEAVFAPDWREEARVTYTLRLLDVLKQLLPDQLEGGISTLPLSYKPWVGSGDGETRRRMVENLTRVAEAMARLEREEGKLVHLDIEPEPDGLVESSAELAAFYRDWLLPLGAPLLASRLGITPGEGEERLLEHVRVCLDACHFAVEYEPVRDAVRRLTGLGVRLGRVQVSSALELSLPEQANSRAELAQQLQRFADSTYLHQVVEAGGGLSYPDLGEALKAASRPGARRWRIHFHVPLFVERYGAFASTQPYTREVLRLVRENRLTRHLEIETYTWEVLPNDLKLDLLDSICREYAWVLGELRVGGQIGAM